MRSVTVNILLALVAQVHAKEHDSMDKLVDNSIDEFANNLIDRVRRPSALDRTELDSTTLGKPAHLAMSPQVNLRPAAVHPRPPSIPGTSTSPWTSYLAAWRVARGPQPAWAAVPDPMQEQDMEKRMKMMKEQVDKAMEDPAVRAKVEAMEKLMSDPKMADQMKMMQSMMQNKEMMAKMQALQQDPDMKPMFEEMQKALKESGPAALNKFYNDPAFLKKIGEKMGPISMPTSPVEDAKAAVAAPEPAAPELKNLLDAARYGDLQALEEFLSVGNDPNEVDNESRTPLHVVAGSGAEALVGPLIKGGAKLEVVDSKGNTPLHYAAGYGRASIAAALLDAGASPAAKNGNGKSPAELAKMNPQNPISKDEALLARLEDGGR